MQRVVLTVQTANAAALRFYQRRGYGPDPTSPELCDDCEPQRMPDGTMGYPCRILCKERPQPSALTAGRRKKRKLR
jgi:hypothetical protein